MPRLPGDIRRSPLANTRAADPSEAIARSVAPAIEGLDEAGKFYQQERARTDFDILQSVGNQAKAFKQEVALNVLPKRRGAQVYGLVEDLQGEWKKSEEKIMATLTNETQRKKAQEILNDEWSDLKGLALGHYNREIQDYRKGNAEGRIKLSQGDAALTYKNKGIEGVKKSLQEQAAALATHPDMQGASHAEFEARYRDLADETHMSVVDDLRKRGDWFGAQKYLDQFEKSMNPRNAAAARASLGDTKLKFRQAFQGLVESKGVSPVRRELVDGLTAPQLEQLNKARVMLISGQTPSTRPDVLQMLQDTAAVAVNSPDIRREFVEQDLDYFYPDLSPEDLAAAKALQQKLREGKGREDGDLRRVVLNDQTVKGLMAQAGIDPTNSKNKDEFVKFRAALYDRLVSVGKGNDYTDQDLKLAAASLLKETTIQRKWFFDKKGRGYDVKPGDVVVGPRTSPQAAPASPNSTAPVVETSGPTPQEKQALALELGMRGKRVDDATVLELWKRKKAAGK